MAGNRSIDVPARDDRRDAAGVGGQVGVDALVGLHRGDVSRIGHDIPQDVAGGVEANDTRAGVDVAAVPLADAACSLDFDDIVSRGQSHFCPI